MIDWAIIHVDGAAANVPAGSATTFNLSATSVPDGAIVFDVTPYITGVSSTSGVLSANEGRYFVSSTKSISFTVYNTTNAAKSWTPHAFVRYILPS